MKYCYPDDLLLGVSVGDYIGIRIGKDANSIVYRHNHHIAESYYPALIVGKVISYAAKPSGMFNSASGQLVVEVPGGKRFNFVYNKASFFSWRVTVDMLLWLDDHYYDPQPAGAFQFAVFDSTVEIQKALEDYTAYQTNSKIWEESRKKREQEQKQAEMIARTKAEQERAAAEAAAARKLDDLFRNAGK